MCRQYSKVALFAISVTCFMTLPLIAQNVRVDVAKRTTSIPKVCESVVPASIEKEIDVPTLVREVICKGNGDMLNDYTYEMKLIQRRKDKKGESKEQATTFEVYIPTLKNGTKAQGIVLVTSRNGVPVPEKELEKERIKAGERLEKEEKKIARQSGSFENKDQLSVQGMIPVGNYNHMGVNRGFGGGASLFLETYLRACNLRLLKREQNDGREALVFGFGQCQNAQFNNKEKYVAQLVGVIWIDTKDRIVTKLVGWPVQTIANNNTNNSTTNDPAPAVYAEMVRMPEGVWLPREWRINGADYPELFNEVTDDAKFIFSEYKRFVTEAKDEKLTAPKEP